MTHAEALQEVRDRAAAYDAATGDKPKANAQGAVKAAAKHAANLGAPTTDVATAAGVDVGELLTWL